MYEWLQKKIETIYVRIDLNWKGCDFQVLRLAEVRMNNAIGPHLKSIGILLSGMLFVLMLSARPQQQRLLWTRREDCGIEAGQSAL
jgi:hypothetical protein